jgi:Na+/glutamate symporter
MQAVCERYGYAPHAFIVVPVVGALLIDIANAIVISAFALCPSCAALTCSDATLSWGQAGTRR